MASDPVTKYARDVVAGRIVAGPYVRGSCRRHLDDLKNGKERGLAFDKEAAQRALDFFPDVLRLNGGQFEGLPFELDPSQAFIVGSLFGWKRKDGTRRFRRAFIEQGKGNGKSPLAGGIGIYGTAADQEPRAEVYAFATKKDQAMILFRDAVAMVKQSPDLTDALRLSGGAGREWNIAHLRSGSFFRPISSDDGQSGPRPHIALGDEVHEHKDAMMIEMIERGFKFRRQPLLFLITNSGSDRRSVCWDEHVHACAVALGDAEDDTTFSYVCALDEDDDPLEDPTCWKKANPLLGVILTEDYLRDVVAQAKAIPAKLNNILRLHFCVWTDADTAWIEHEAWVAAEDETLRIEDFHGSRAWLGLDLSSNRDMTGKAIVIDDGLTEDGRPKYVLFCRGYLPGDDLAEKAKTDRAPYDLWADQGFITATPGKATRLDFLARDLVADCHDFDVSAIAYDAWLIKRFDDELADLGADLPVIEHPQGYSRRKDTPLFMPDSIDALETLLLEGRIRIAVNPALRSAVMSATFLTSPAGLRRFAKERATARIDLAVAMAMAVGAAVQEAGGGLDMEALLSRPMVMA